MPTELLNLAKIFNNRVFRIPDYQRGYAWGDRQLADFWSDLCRVTPDRTHYCGQLTLEKAPPEAWKQWTDDSWLVAQVDFEPQFVVDGQQRLTTAVILLQCLLENGGPDDMLAGQKISELRERYLAKSSGVLRSGLFGYAKDNPSHEFFRTQVLGIPSNEYNGIRTAYTANLGTSLAYFRAKVAAVPGDREKLFRALTQRFHFNLHELSSEIDVFVAFETMNNRGKALSRLELLKNRLIYLSTLGDGSDAERKKVRASINAVWRTVYEELGRHPKHSLDDDDFLRAHWIVFFGYDKDEADPLTQFLLNHHFTTEALDGGKLSLKDIQTYADSLQVSARVWQRLHFPENQAAVLGDKVARALTRLKRLGFGVLRPLILAALSKVTDLDNAGLLLLLKHAERFLLLVRSFAGTRSNVGEAESYRMAHEIQNGQRTVAKGAEMLAERVARHFSYAAFKAVVEELFAEDSKGFYELPALKFVLYEYEEALRIEAKSTDQKISWEDFRGARGSVEHVFPQTPLAEDWPQFAAVPAEKLRYLTHGLGNLVAVSVAKNAALSRRAFTVKKLGNEKTPGFNQGSYSELRIATADDWTPKSIKERGIELLRFIENRWETVLGNDQQKVELLGLGFVH